MYQQENERRNFNRFCDVPVKVSLKNNGEIILPDMVDIGLGGMMVSTTHNFNIYEEYECNLKVPLDDDEYLIHTKTIVWRIDPDEENMKEQKRFVVFRFSEIQEYDRVVISELLTSF